MTTQPRPAKLTADEFLAWAEHQPDRHELVAGEIFAMAAERAGHVRGKGATFMALAQAIRAGGLACEAMVDGMAVRIDDQTVYEPDVLVRCGAPVPTDALEIRDPTIVVEIVSPSSRSADTGAKLAGYFGLASIQHHLVVDTTRQVVTHHRREDGGSIATRALRDGPLALDPPGITVQVAEFFATA